MAARDQQHYQFFIVAIKNCWLSRGFYYHGEWIIELKSLKEYLGVFRDSVMSYERLINVIYDDLMEKYGPQRLRLEMDCNARGGISSKLKIDSDWKVRGGQELYQHWKE